MICSEKTAREFSKYVVKLVKRQPNWLRTLFEEELIYLVIEDSGLMQIACSNDLEKDTANHAIKLIEKYMDKHPNPCIGVLSIQ